MLLDAAGAGARVCYSTERGRYVVIRVLGDIEFELIAGRYEVVYAWIRGYHHGRTEARRPPP